jgi:hypothetical protein
VPADSSGALAGSGRFAAHWGKYLQTPSDQETIAPVLGLTILAIVLTPVLGDKPWGRVILAFLVGMSALLALIRTGAHGALRKTATVAIIFATITAAGAHTITAPGRSSAAQILATALFTLLLIVTPTVVVLRLLLRPRVTLDTLAGALTAYLQIGIFFGSLYRLIDLVGSQPFFAGDPPATTQTFQYFSFITMATVGYGDYTPITMAGRLVAVCIMGVGLTTVAVVTAQIASSFSDQAAVRRAVGIDGSDDATEHEIDEVPEVSVSENGSSPSSDEGPTEADDHQRHLALLARLQRIEAMLLSQERT